MLIKYNNCSLSENERKLNNLCSLHTFSPVFKVKKNVYYWHNPTGFEGTYDATNLIKSKPVGFYLLAKNKTQPVGKTGRVVPVV
jgi:hypothetical protein